ncbi:MAG: hypothetical protein ACLQVD_01880 [Capsulimonadaceae bacterium]
MTITVNFTPAEEASLSHAAMHSGIALEDLVRKIVREHLPDANPLDEMRRRIREWQEQDNTPTPPVSVSRPGLTPTAALFQVWMEEDALRTEDEIAANDRLWEDYKQGIDDERQNAGMRTLF